MIERIVNKAKSFKEAHDWDVQQNVSMTAQERVGASRVLREKVYRRSKDVRECHKSD